MTRSKSSTEVAARPDAEIEVKNEYRTSSRLDIETRMNIRTFDDALNIATEFGTVVDTEDMGDGFVPLSDLNKLVDKPLVIIDWHYGKNKKYGTDFMIIRLITKDNEKYLIVDGSTGIMRQLEMYTKLSSNKIGAIRCKRGFNRSDYFYSNKMQQVVDKDYVSAYDGDKIEACTFYINEG